MNRARWCLLPAVAFLFVVACDQSDSHGKPPAADDVSVYGISTSLPIVWPEAHDLAGMLQPTAKEHWAMAALRERGEVRPLDTLADETGALPLPADAVLVLAQPFPFSPDEYVALDDWVRRGGKVLLFADPMLTFHSAFALGDRRRPQDIVKLDPILGRWGLALNRDREGQAPETATVAIGGQEMPVALPGRFSLVGKSGCRLEYEGLVAECRIGRGRVLAVADAALLERDADPEPESRRAVLFALLDRLARHH